MENVVRTVSSNSGGIRYYLERKPVKNLNLRICRDGRVFVSANFDASISEIDEFVRRKDKYIQKAVKRFEEMARYQSQPKKYVSGETFYIQGRGLRLRVLKDDRDSVTSDGVYIILTVKEPDNTLKKQKMVQQFLDQQCKTVFGEIVEELYPIFRKYGVGVPLLHIRDMDTRWGTCLKKKGIITLNKRLLQAPRNCIEYVVMHEYCHFLYPNHSKQFYSFLSVLMPDWKERKQTLEKMPYVVYGSI